MATIDATPEPEPFAASHESDPHAPGVTTTADTRADLIARSMPLVHYLAGSMLRRGSTSAVVDYDDLVGYGIEGLIEAVDTFNPTYNVRFSTWAVMHIRTTIQDALRALDPLPRSIRSKVRDIERASADLAHRTGSWPTSAQVAAELAMPIGRLRATIEAMHHTVVSLDQVHEADNEERPTSWVTSLADTDPHTDPEAVLDTSVLHALLHEVVAGLPGREAQVVDLYYGQRKSMRAIGKALGVTESRVSQIHAGAIQRLRAAMRIALSDVPRHVA